MAWITLPYFLIILNLLSDVNGNDYYSKSDQIILSRERRSAVNFYRTGQKLQGEMSSTLNQLLGPNYNKRIRPNYGGPPVIVELNLSIRSIGTVCSRKNPDSPKNMLLLKNPQFLLNHYESWPK